MFEQTDQLINQFYKDAGTFVRKLKTVRIPIKVVESEYPLGTVNGINYNIVPRP